MTIVLLILKIIGVLLLLLIAVLLLVLFVPIRYRAAGSYHSKLQVRLRVSWLCHLITFGLDMLPGQNDMYLRIFGIKKILTKADNAEEFEDTIEEIAEESAVDIAEEGEHAAKHFADASVEKETGDAPQKDIDKPPQADSAASPKKRRRGFHPFLRITQKVKDIYARIKTAVVRIFSVFERILGLVSDAQNKQAVRFLLGKLFRLTGRMLPKQLKLDLVYSTGSPDTTGEVLGVLALFPMGYEQRWNITPDFTADSFFVEAEFDVRGRFFLYQIVGTALSVLLDKNCRRLYNEITNGS